MSPLMVTLMAFPVPTFTNGVRSMMVAVNVLAPALRAIGFVLAAYDHAQSRLHRHSPV